MPIMEIVDVISVTHGNMPAARTVGMRVIGVVWKATTLHADFSIHS